MKNTVIFDMKQTIFQPTQTEDARTQADILAIKEMPEAMATFLSFYHQNYKIVIISDSEIQKSRERLQYLLTVHQVDQDTQKQIFSSIDILTMQYFGSKHDPDAWKKAMEPYHNIEYIFEDGENKLQAAGEAAQALGSQPQLFTSIAEFNHLAK